MPTTRDHLVLFVNGRRVDVHGSQAFLSLARYLREDLGLTGTKVACAEGDCGSCSVLVGRPGDGAIDYLVVNACLLGVFQVDGCHVVTVEGLTPASGPSRPQRAFIEGHASQCGFCTPGFVVALQGMTERGQRGQRGGAGVRAGGAVETLLRDALVGNLCRCTGYVQILEAAKEAQPLDGAPLASLFPEEDLLAAMVEVAGEGVLVDAEVGGRRRTIALPVDWQEAVRAREARPDALVVAGGTDVGIGLQRGALDPDAILGLGRVSGLAHMELGGAGAERLIVGAGVTWTALADHVRGRLPQLTTFLERFGSTQIRNVATVVGNIVNASPIADGAPLLLVLEADLELTGPEGDRRVSVLEFYEGYKRTRLRPDELVRAVTLPLPTADAYLGLQKVSKRRHMDLATLTGALLVRCEGERIVEARMAYGGASPFPMRLPRAERALIGSTFSADSFTEAGRIAAEEVRPISDVRGSAAYRTALARNLPLAIFHEFDQTRRQRAEVGHG